MMEAVSSVLLYSLCTARFTMRQHGIGRLSDARGTVQLRCVYWSSPPPASLFPLSFCVLPVSSHVLPPSPAVLPPVSDLEGVEVEGLLGIVLAVTAPQLQAQRALRGGRGEQRPRAARLESTAARVRSVRWRPRNAAKARAGPHGPERTCAPQEATDTVGAGDVPAAARPACETRSSRLAAAIAIVRERVRAMRTPLGPPAMRRRLLLAALALLQLRMAGTWLAPAYAREAAVRLRRATCAPAQPGACRRRPRERPGCARMQDASWSPLHFAAGAGDEDAARHFLAEGHPVDPQITSGHTPLHIAAQMGHATVVRLLLQEAGADVDARTHEGITPLYVALQQGRIAVGRMLMDSGADVNAQTASGNTALHMAAQRGSLEAAELLVKSGQCEVNACTARGHTPLHLAVEHQHPAVALLLLQSGAATDCSDNIGHQPLHLAATLGSPELVHLLLQHGASVNEACSRGYRPLDIAILRESPSACLEALLSKGAAVTPHPWNNQTALHAAAFLGRQDAVDLLLAHGANADARLHLQRGDGMGERQGAAHLETRARAYEAAISAAASQSDAQTQLAAQGRLGAVQMQLAAREQDPDKLEDKPEVDKLEDLCVNLDETGALARAVGLWNQQGVVVFPSLLSAEEIDVLQRHAVEVCGGGGAGAVDRSANIRKPLHRTLRAVGVQERPEALEAIASKLSPFLDICLQDARQLVLEQAAYCISPGAGEQEWHRDDSLVDSRIMSLQVSLVDTVAEQGAFQVQPGTHRYSVRDGSLPPLRSGGGDPHFQIAVPAGSLMCYSPNVVHRGGANTSDKKRWTLALTLLGEHGLIPNGIPLAVQQQDQGRWWLQGGELKSP